MKEITFKPAPYNPRKINASKFEKLEDSIEELGDLSGVTINTTTGNVVTGHQRLKALGYAEGEKLRVTNRKLKKDDTGTIATGYVVSKDGSEKLSYREVQWTFEKEKNANIAANKLGGEFDKGKLAELLTIEELMTVGFTEDELQWAQKEPAFKTQHPVDNPGHRGVTIEIGGTQTEQADYPTMMVLMYTKDEAEEFLDTISRLMQKHDVDTISDAFLKAII